METESKAAYQQAAKNTDPPDVRCGMCGGAATLWHPNGWRDRARWIECVGPCSWSSHDPRRANWWWVLRVWWAALTAQEVSRG